LKDIILAWIERVSGKINNWAWDKRWKYREHHQWIDGYRKWSELKDKGVVSDKVKLKDLKKRCPPN